MRKFPGMVGATPAWLAAAAAAVGLVGSARANINIAQADNTSINFTSWAVTPNAGDTTSNTTNIGQFNVTENSYTGQSGFTVPTPNGSLSQSFKATAGGTLTDLEILASGAISGVTFNLALYDIGPAGSNGDGLADESTQGYGNNAGGVQQNSGTGLVQCSLNLLSSASQGLVAPAYSTNGATAAVLDFQLSGADAITLTSGDEYVLEVNNPSSTNLILLRNGATGDYALGQAFRDRAPLNGNPARDFAVAAVVAVPEPASLGVIALATSAMTLRRRRTR